MTTTVAFGARAEMSPNSVLSAPGSWLLACASAWLTALTQVLVEPSTQVIITLEKPTSLPPIVMDTSVVAGDSAESWLLITSVVVAPEQATKANEAGAFAFAHNWA